MTFTDFPVPLHVPPAVAFALRRAHHVHVDQLALVVIVAGFLINVAGRRPTVEIAPAAFVSGPEILVTLPESGLESLPASANAVIAIGLHGTTADARHLIHHDAAMPVSVRAVAVITAVSAVPAVPAVGHHGLVLPVAVENAHGGRCGHHPAQKPGSGAQSEGLCSAAAEQRVALFVSSAGIISGSEVIPRVTVSSPVVVGPVVVVVSPVTAPVIISASAVTAAIVVAISAAVGLLRVSGLGISAVGLLRITSAAG